VWPGYLHLYHTAHLVWRFAGRCLVWAALGAAVPVQAGALRIEVNLPAYTLRLLDGDRVVMERPVTIGEAKHPTPAGSWRIERLVWNPRWVPPPSADSKRPRPPGPDNPMGRVKLPITGPYYLHGTHRTGELGQPVSLGCIRLANDDARELARFLQQRLVSEQRRARVRRQRERTPGAPVTVPFSEPVPIRVDYEPVVMEGDRGVIYPDVYDRVPHGRKALKRAVARSLQVAPEDLELRARALLERLGRGGRGPLRFALRVEGSNGMEGEGRER